MSLTSTHAQYDSLPMRSPTSATIPLDMANYEALPFDRDAISSTNSLAMYGLGASALGSGKGNDPYSFGGKAKANTPPRWTAPSNPNLSSDSSLSSRSHDFIQTPYQASLPHPLPRPIQERAWPSVSVGSDDLAQMGFPMPSPMVGHDSVAQGKKRALPPLPAGVPIQVSAFQARQQEPDDYSRRLLGSESRLASSSTKLTVSLGLIRKPTSHQV